VFYLILCLTLSTSKFTNTGKKEISSNTLLSIKLASANAEAVDCQTVKKLINDFTEERDRFKKECKLNQMPELNEFYESSELLGSLKGAVLNHEFSGNNEILQRFLKLGENYKYAEFAAALISKGKQAHVSEFDKIWNVMDDEVSLLHQSSGGLPHAFNVEIWKNLKLTSDLKTALVLFGDNYLEECLPAVRIAFKFVADWLAYYDHCCCNYRFELISTDSFHIPSDAFVIHGISISSFHHLAHAELLKQPRPLIHGYKNNIKNFDFTLEAGSTPTKSVLKIIYKGEEHTIDIKTSCTDFVFLNIFFERFCGNIKMVVAFRSLHSNGFDAISIDVDWRDVEGLSLNYVSETNSKHVYYNVESTPEDELEIFTQFSIDKADKFLAAVEPCDNSKDCAYYNQAEDSCVECKELFYILENKQCVKNCPKGYLNNEWGFCEKACLENCKECAAPLVKFIESETKNSCVETCPEATYMDADQNACIKCVENCDACSNSKTCDKCNFSTSLQEGLCVERCAEGYFQDFNPNTCKKCTEGCESCNNLERCDRCSEGFYLKNGVCVQNCGSGLFGNDNSRKCDTCSDFCESCDETRCYSCMKAFDLVDGVCVPHCEPNQTLYKGVCVSCTDPNCLTCDLNNLQICLKCNSDYVLQNGKCDKSCNEYSYANEASECVDCPKNCKTCTQDKCLICDNGLYIFGDNQCISDCPDGYTTSGNTCLKCTNPSCRKCSESSLDVCESCYPNNLLQNGNCQEKCSEGYYQSGSSCLECSEGCKQCDNALSCNDCDDDYFLKSERCVKNCEAGYMANNQAGTCDKCNESNCSQCDSSVLECQKCDSPLLLYAGKCVSKCPVGTFLTQDVTCNDCPQDCDECSNESTCNRCKIPKVLNQNFCINECPANTINIQNVCINCTQPNCQTCDSSLDNCLQCTLDSFLLNGKCVDDCPVGYFNDFNKCSPCNPLCTKCTSAEVCQACIDNYILLNNHTCTDKCPAGYIEGLVDNNAKVTFPVKIEVTIGQIEGCIKCPDEGCLKCSDKDISTCIQCESPLLLLNGDCYERCPSGHYADNEICSPCSQGCKSCTSPLSCDKCDEGLFLKGTSCESECGDGYAAIDDVCHKCKDNCKSCQADQLNLCTACYEGLLLLNSKCIYECPAKYWENTTDKTCLPCATPSCAKCSSNGETCVTCAFGLVLNDNSCVPSCPVGKVDVDGTCQQCEVNNCQVCPASNTKICTTCVTPNLLIDNYTCSDKCPQGKFSNGSSCDNCPSNCAECNNSETCITCNNQSVLYNGQCLASCPEGTRDDNGVCKACSLENCASCTSSNCVRCKNPLILAGNKCITECEEGTYNNNGLSCECCSNFCEKCDSFDNCLKCEAGKYLTDGKCLDGCPAEYVQKGEKCVKCQTDENCLKCDVNDPKTCTVCKDNFVLLENLCLESCPPGYYAFNGECYKCNDNCLTCENSTQCQRCKTDFYLNNDRCVSECPVGHYELLGKCVPCSDSNCDICTSDNCNKCKADFYKEEGVCVNQCSAGYFLFNFLECRKCSENCINCSDANTCTNCLNGLLLKNGQCVQDCGESFVAIANECQPCDNGCKVCSNSDQHECLECSELNLKNGKCVSDCGATNYADNKVCKSCIDSCDICNSNQNCSKCSTGFVYQENLNKCLDACVAGYTNVDGVCQPCGVPGCNNCSLDINKCDECNSNLYKLDNTCVETCAVDEGYYVNNRECLLCPNECATCKSATECSTCVKGFVLYGNSCINNCPEGQTEVDGKCEACTVTNCLVCTDVDKCIKCAVDKVLLNNECLDSCPESYFNNNGSCELCNNYNCSSCKNSSTCDVCRPGFLLNDGECVASCPLGSVERNLKCYPCNDKNCLNCDNLTLDSCSNCRLPYKLKGTSCVDDCGSATFITEVNGSQTCGDCKQNCVSCTSSDNCNQCADNFFLKNNECVENCGSNYVAVGQECKKCTDDLCEVCSPNNQDVCLKCSSPNFLNAANNCVASCGERFYERQSPSAICVNCIDLNCLQCSPENKCLLCDQGFFRFNFICIETCPTGFYADNSDNSCKSCGQKECDQCAPGEPSRCEKCREGLFLNNGECVDTCPTGTFVNELGHCQDCNKNCESCKDNTTCYKCKSPFVLDGTICTDNCPEGEVNINNSCVDCDQKAECVKCDPTSVDKCLECQPQFLLLDNDRCVDKCPAGYFENGRKCTKCESDCNTCESETLCVKCFAPTVEYNGDCIAACGNGLVEIDGHCVPCADSVRCNTCKSDLTTCLECRQPFVLNVDNTCRLECSAGTYYNVENNKCEPCGENCNKCDNDKLCTDCTAPYSNDNGKCVEECPVSNYLDTENNCKPCGAGNCVKCSNLNPNKCLECNVGFILSGEPDTQCVEKCPNGTVLKSVDPSPAFVEVKSKKLRLGKGIISVQQRYPECFPCPNGCASCDESSCTACVSPLVLVDGKCLSNCKPGYTNRDNTCIKCNDDNCLTCDPNNLNNCLVCKEPSILFGGVCIDQCPQGLFLKGYSCVECPANCQDCDEFGCLKCKDGFIFNGDTDQCTTCIPPSQDIDGRCRTCDAPNCNKCVEGNPNSCEICSSPSLLLNGNCIDNCPDGFFSTSSVCLPCREEELTCKRAPCSGDCDPNRIDEDATKCKKPNVLYQRRCRATCPDGTVEIDGECPQCSQSECSQCENDLSTCLKCSPDTWLFNNKCVNSCPDRYLYVNGACEKCSDNCIKCESDKCTQCDEGFKIQDNLCVLKCSLGYMDQGDSCAPCVDSNCDVCSPVNSCQTCNSKTYLTNSETCVTNCADGFFKNEETRSCDKCDKGCLQCTGPKQCVECAEGLNMLNGQCLAECPVKMTPLNRNCVDCTQASCLSCEVGRPDKCTQCDSSNVLFEGQCLSECPLSTFRRRGECQDCESKCLNCTDENTCTKCRSEFFLNGHQCESKCPDGKTSIENGTCVDCAQPNCKSCTANINSCIECKSPFNLNDEKCVDVCPNGKYPSNGKCLPCKEGCSECNLEGQCDKCKSGYYYLNGECFKSCPAGFYPNCKTDQCEKCDESCDGCHGNGAENCSVCAKGYFLNGEACMKPEKCSPGTYANTDDFSCAPCKVLYCKECSDANTCTSCNKGFTLEEGQCNVGNTLMNVFPNSRLFDDYNFHKNHEAQIFELGKIGGVGILSPHITVSFWMRLLVPYGKNRITIISLINNSQTAYNWHLGIDGESNLVFLSARNHLDKDVGNITFGYVSYEKLRNWQLVSLSIVKGAYSFEATFSYFDNGKFYPLTDEIVRRPAISDILTKESSLVFNENDNTKGNFQISNANVFDYIPSDIEINKVQGLPNDCDYGCTDCRITCKKCIDGNAPIGNYCKAMGPRVSGLTRITADQSLNVELVAKLNHDNVSDKHAFTLWFFIDQQVDLHASEIHLYEDFYQVTGSYDKFIYKSNNSVLIRDGKLLVNGEKVAENITLSTNKWYHLFVGFSTDANLVGLTDIETKSSDSAFLAYEYVKNIDDAISIFNHFTVKYQLPSGSSYNVNTYVNNWPTPAEIKEQHKDLNLPADCLSISHDLSCSKCREHFELGTDGLCHGGNTIAMIQEKSDELNSKPKACDSGCIDCDNNTGKCRTCATGAKDLMICPPFLLGFANTYTYDMDLFDESVKKSDFINLLTNHGFNVEVKSIDYSAVGYFKVWGDFASNTNYRIVSIGNKEKVKDDNDAGKHVAVMDLNSTGLTTSKITFTITAENQNVEIPVENFTVNSDKWYAYHFGVNVDTKKFTYGIIDITRKEEVHSGSGDFPAYPEKLQEVGGISLLGVNDNLDSKKYSSLNIHLRNSFIIPNRGYSQLIFQKFLDIYPIPADAKCNKNCQACVENADNKKLVCLRCAQGFLKVNDECLQS